MPLQKRIIASSIPSKAFSHAEDKDKLTDEGEDNVKKESNEEEHYGTSEENNQVDESTSTLSPDDSDIENNTNAPEYDLAKTNPEEGLAEPEDKF